MGRNNSGIDTIICMKVLMISRDSKAVDSSSEVFRRLKEYSTLFDELHVVVIGKGKNKRRFKERNLFIYPALSSNILFAFLKGLSVSFIGARKVGKDSIVTVQDPFESGFIGVIVKKIFSLKLQVQVHTDFLSANYLRCGFKNKIKAFFGKAVLSEASGIRVVSEKLKNDVEKLFENQKQKPIIFVLPIFVDIENINKQTNLTPKISFGEYHPIILMVARLESEKNIELGIHAFARLLKHEPQALLVVAGDGSERKKLERLTKYLNLQEKVKFVGWKDNLFELYKSADAFLSTSYYEGFGMALLEASVAGLSVVSTDVGIAGELGVRMTSYDPGEIALAIIDEIKNENKKYDLGKFMKTKRDYLLQFKDTFNV